MPLFFLNQLKLSRFVCESGFVFALGFVYILGSNSSVAQAADLLEVYHLAQANDPSFDAARYALQAAEQKIPQARAGLLPTC